jgi:hypothetical protein
MLSHIFQTNTCIQSNLRVYDISYVEVTEFIHFRTDFFSAHLTSTQSGTRSSPRVCKQTKSTTTTLRRLLDHA